MKDQRSRHNNTTSRRQGLGTRFYARADVVLFLVSGKGLRHHLLRSIVGAAPRVRLWADNYLSGSRPNPLQGH